MREIGLAREFLRGLGIASVDASAIAANMAEEMAAGLEGRPSSLAMIRTYLEVPGFLSPGRRAIAIDAGGTNLRAALCEVGPDGAVAILQSARARMPGAEGAMAVDEFFDAIAALAAPFLEGGGGLPLGFTFSYPMEILPDREGRLMGLCKELVVPGIEGRLVGASLREALGRRGLGAGEIAMLNDSSATLLAGSASPGARGSPEERMGFILGTGLNSCYVEPGGSGGPGQIIVTEAGAFDCAARTELDRAFDAGRADPGSYAFEKMFSGAYLGPLAWRLLSAAAAEGLLGEAFSAALAEAEPFGTPEIDAFLRSPVEAAGPGLASCLGQGSGVDRSVCYYLCEGLVERAARLAAATMAAPILRLGAGGDPLEPARIAADGSTFWGLRGLREKSLACLGSLLAEAGPLFAAVERVDEGSLLGAAIAAMA